VHALFAKNKVRFARRNNYDLRCQQVFLSGH